MRKRKQIVVAGLAAVVAAGALGIGTAVAGGSGGDSEGSASGPAADHAVAAALELTGGGTANAVERDSENGATWEVEVTKLDGSTVDVRLDGGYGLVVVEGGSEHADSGDAGEND